MNPLKLMQLKNMLQGFKRRHPKLPAFFKDVYSHGVKEGSILQFQVTSPEGKKYVANIRLTKDDIAFFNEIENLKP